MSYFVTVSFDLKNASSDDYETAYSELAKIGVHKILVSDSAIKVSLPTTTCAGTFTGSTPVSVRGFVAEKIQQAFQSQCLQGEIFVAVGGDWAWVRRIATANPLAAFLRA
jgi:hypothetical protein